MFFKGIPTLEDLFRLAATPTIPKLKAKYQNVLNDKVFNDIISSDPTYKGGDQSGSYTPWLLNFFAKDIEPDENFVGADQNTYNHIKEMLDLFTRVKANLEKKDIYQYQSLKELNNALDNYKFEKFKRNTPPNSKIDYEDSNWIVVIPRSYEDSCYWGKGTTWCTADPKTESYYNDYSSDGSLYIIINKNRPSEKYQFHARDESFNDADDAPVSFRNFRKEVGNSDPEFYDYLDNMVQDAYDEYNEKSYEKESEAAYEAFENGASDGLNLFKDAEGKIPSNIVDEALQIMWDYNYYEYSRGERAYIFWDDIRDRLIKKYPDAMKEALPIIIQRNFYKEYPEHLDYLADPQTDLIPQYLIDYAYQLALLPENYEFDDNDITLSWYNITEEIDKWLPKLQLEQQEKDNVENYYKNEQQLDLAGQGKLFAFKTLEDFLNKVAHRKNV